MEARDHLAVALDVADLDEAQALIQRLGGVPGWLKVGAELFTVAGPEALRSAGAAARVFLDTKLHDIPHQVARTVAAATRHRVGMLTLHACGGSEMLRAARRSAEETAAAEGLPRPTLLAVTVLTSLTPADLKEIGLSASRVAEQVERLVDLARESGIDGVVASPLEAAAIRDRTGPDFCIVTPGVRAAGAPQQDQARTASAGEAIAAGADVLVVGRPVTRSPDPGAAARALVGEIEAALAARTG